ncbi:hypothetical protein AGABI1DRAFT_126879 [Agaricus bisporus var. burnettii JB137-S8]|uniref:Uncharacterized protein n=2 Tax=Agaricus bisporus var. burnettii TaxID=192524 RepID=K5XC09_AGABU|nr:uncharacterized protein AGABI1DRAFT_126879 [Agaricus bisporus var. burnettii JB137-S8]EKM80838.1 hypothetical protein AGABI1DRAFT_126879 [Agaricus bisporus var. burnettii JB137-S8]KAF7782452.1 hypothetical protein Agabi119p4_1828 [Agaricus bisporus var. burnettii]
MSPHPRSLRPLNAKCQALAAHLAANDAQHLAALQPTANLGFRIHFSTDIRATLDLSRKIYAVRDAYSDLVAKLHGDAPLLSSLASLCATILGAQFHCDDSSTDVLFDAIPSAYRPRALLMHALHLIIDSCPPCPSLYLALLDLTLERRLYHESEVLLDLTLECAFESRRDVSPRITNPAHRRFLVDLYCKWHTQFPSSIYVRLVTSALLRAGSGLAWTSKATRLLARKISRYEPSLLPDLVGSLVDTILSPRPKFKGKQRDIDGLEKQLFEWFDLCVETCLSSIKILSTHLLIFDRISLIEDVLDLCRSRTPLASYGSLGSTFLDAIACLYTLWLVYEPRKISKHDALYQLLQRSFPSSSTFSFLCFQLLRLKSLTEYESILSIFSSTLLHNGFPRIQSSLWVCALYCIEDSETEQVLVEQHGQGAFKQLRLQLISHVEEVENKCLAALSGAELSYGNEDITSRDSCTVDHLGGPSKRRKVESCPHQQLSRSHYCRVDRRRSEETGLFKRRHPKSDVRHKRYRAGQPSVIEGDPNSKPHDLDDTDDTDAEDDNLGILEEALPSSEDPLDLFRN